MDISICQICYIMASTLNFKANFSLILWVTCQVTWHALQPAIAVANGKWGPLSPFLVTKVQLMDSDDPDLLLLFPQPEMKEFPLTLNQRKGEKKDARAPLDLDSVMDC